MSHPSQKLIGRLWSVQAGFGPVHALATAVLPDGRTIGVTGGSDGTVRLWNLTTGEAIVVVPAHRGPVAMTERPVDAGLVALTVGDDGLLTAWDVLALI